MSILNLAGLTISATELLDFTSPDATMIYSIAEGMNMRLTGNVIKCNYTVDDSFTQRLLNNETNPKYAQTNTIYVKGAKTISLYKNQVQQCANVHHGGFIRAVDSGTLEDVGSTFEQCSAIFGGVISLSNTTASMNSSSFSFNYAHRGGAIHLEKGARMVNY